MQRRPSETTVTTTFSPNSVSSSKLPISPWKICQNRETYRAWSSFDYFDEFSMTSAYDRIERGKCGKCVVIREKAHRTGRLADECGLVNCDPNRVRG